MNSDMPGDVGAPLLDTTTSNYLCCAIMLKALPGFLVLQLQVAFSTESYCKISDHEKATNLIKTNAQNLLNVTRPYLTQMWGQKMNLTVAR